MTTPPPGSREVQALDEIEAALALIVNATEAAFESGALFTYEEGEPRPEWANTVTSPFYFGPGILPKVSKAFSLISILRDALAPPADGAGEVEAINTNDLRDYADRISNPYAQFILDAASQLDYARTDRNILQAELDAERARRAEVEGRHSTGWGSIYWWINAADKHAEYISERGYLIDGDHWQMISSLARATHKDTQDEH